MKKKLLAALLAALLLLSGCQYSVVEDADEQQLLRGNAAIAETATPSPTAQPLQNGSRDGEGESAVSDLQKRLQALNYLDGKADGIFGEDTQAALEAFQALNGLPETGVLDAGTQAALGSAMAVPMPTPEPTPLAKGAKGDGVREVQEALRAYGFMTGSADGDFGKLTDEGLKLFQQYLYVVEGREYYTTPEPTLAPTATPAPSPTQEPSPTLLLSQGADDQVIVPTETPQPTATPYAPDGVMSDGLMAELANFEVYRVDMERGSRDTNALGEVHRLQRRLDSLMYLEGGIDGIFGGGTESALKYFQKRNKLPETGVADEATQRALFSESAVKSDRPKCMYMLKISVDDQRVYAYKWVNGSYSQLVRTMKCSTGTTSDPTPLGTFTAGGPCGRWYYFKKFDCWAQYAYRINGPYLFHSVLYSEKDTATLRQSSVNNLGRRASHGCVRLSVEDAKWIYNNCPAGTTVKVY